MVRTGTLTKEITKNPDEQRRKTKTMKRGCREKGRRSAF